MLKQRRNYFSTEEGKAIRKALQSLAQDIKYNTLPTYHPNAVRFPDHLIPFVDKHMDYLNAHPQMDAWIYIANVRMGTLLR